MARTISNGFRPLLNFCIFLAKFHIFFAISCMFFNIYSFYQTRLYLMYFCVPSFLTSISVNISRKYLYFNVYSYSSPKQALYFTLRFFLQYSLKRWYFNVYAGLLWLTELSTKVYDLSKKSYPEFALKYQHFQPQYYGFIHIGKDG